MHTLSSSIMPHTAASELHPSLLCFAGSAPASLASGLELQQWEVGKCSKPGERKDAMSFAQHTAAGRPGSDQPSC